MSSLKDAAAEPMHWLQPSSSKSTAQNKPSMSVTPDVSHVEMGPCPTRRDVAVVELTVEGCRRGRRFAGAFA